MRICQGAAPWIIIPAAMRSRVEPYPRVPRAAIGFKPEYLDFDRGIRVGNLEDNERITRLLKLELEHRYRQPFVTERWGRGVFWIWIGYLPRANREAKPLSNRVSFGCSKFFVMVDTEARVFQSGFQVERGYVKPPPDSQGCRLESDWDWNRLVAALRTGSPFVRELERLVKREGFALHAGGWESAEGDFKRRSLPGAAELRRLLQKAPPDHWAGFQVYYPMTETEVLSSTGPDLIEAMMAIFAEVTPLMNACMQIELDA